jgi:hypothetical protein
MDRVRIKQPDVKGTNMNDLVARYLACWNETDPAARRKLIEQTWAEDASYIDPLADAHGLDAIEATIAAAQAQFPGFVFTLAGPVDAHHKQARFTWGLGPEGAEPLVVGFDVAVTDDEDKISAVLGFLDKVPA